MEHLDQISVEALQDALDSVEGKTPTKRLLAAIAYKNGVSQTELADWYGVHRKTIYNWLIRFDADTPIEHAVTDDIRSGRNRKLSESQQEAFETAVHDSPEAVGIDAPAWTPALVRRFLAETYGVEYSLPSCRRLLKEAGLRYRPPRSSAAPSEAGYEPYDDSEGGDGRWIPS